MTEDTWNTLMGLMPEISGFDSEIGHDPAGKDRFTTINSCLCPVGSVDGASITTAEGIGNSKAGYHAVQGVEMSWHYLSCSLWQPLPVQLNLPAQELLQQQSRLS